MSTKVLVIWLILASLIIILSACGASRAGYTIVHTAGKMLPDQVVMGDLCTHKVTSVSKESFEARYLCAGFKEVIIKYELHSKGVQ